MLSISPRKLGSSCQRKEQNKNLILPVVKVARLPGAYMCMYPMCVQLLAGLLLVLLGRWNINCPWEQRRSDMLNNVVVMLAFLISVVNVLLTAFSPDSPMPEDRGHHPHGGWFAQPS